MPLTISVTVQTAPAGMFSYVFETVPAAVPAGITQSGVRLSGVSSHTTWIVIGPCCPAPSPLIVLWTISEPGAGTL